MVLPPLMLLMSTYSLALQALVKGTEWLDRPYAGVSAASVMGPAIAAAWCLWLLLAVVTLSALWHVPGIPPHEAAGDFPGEPPSYESLSDQMPALLVRESSTLFRQVSARTQQAYNRRYGKLEEEEEAVADGIDIEAPRPRDAFSPACAPTAAAMAPAGARSAAADVPGSGSGGGGGSPAVPSTRSVASQASPISPTSLSGRFRSSGLLRDKSKRNSKKDVAASSVTSGGGTAAPSVETSPPESGRSSAPAPTPIEPEAGSCWVCFADVIHDEAVLLHCGHAGLCLTCADNLWRRRLACPICRETVSLIARVGDSVAVDGKLVVSPSLPTREALAGQLAPPSSPHPDSSEV